MTYGKEITGHDLNAAGNFTVTLTSVGNPDRNQDPYSTLHGVKNSAVVVKTKQEASDVCRKFINDNELGGGNWSGGDIFSDGKLVARVSYNGRVWHIAEDDAEKAEASFDQLVAYKDMSPQMQSAFDARQGISPGDRKRIDLALGLNGP